MITEISYAKWSDLNFAKVTLGSCRLSMYVLPHWGAIPVPGMTTPCGHTTGRPCAETGSGRPSVWMKVSLNSWPNKKKSTWCYMKIHQLMICHVCFILSGHRWLENMPGFELYSAALEASGCCFFGPIFRRFHQTSWAPWVLQYFHHFRLGWFGLLSL